MAQLTNRERLRALIGTIVSVRDANNTIPPISGYLEYSRRRDRPFLVASRAVSGYGVMFSSFQVYKIEEPDTIVLYGKSPNGEVR